MKAGRLKYVPRSRRTIIPGLPHHVVQRGARRQTVFFRPKDYELYLELLEHYTKKYNVELLSYCLMLNHSHLFAVPKDETGLSKAVQLTHKRFAYSINKRFEWSGHLWQERFYSTPVDYSSALTVFRYIERNPVKAQIATHPADYTYSSANGYCTGNPSAKLSLPPWWKEQLASIPNIFDWLDSPVELKDEVAIRRCLSRDLPLGNDAFLDKLEKSLGRPMRPKNRGRPSAKKVTVTFSLQKSNCHLFRRAG